MSEKIRLDRNSTVNEGFWGKSTGFRFLRVSPIIFLHRACETTYIYPLFGFRPRARTHPGSLKEFRSNADSANIARGFFATGRVWRVDDRTNLGMSENGRPDRKTTGKEGFKGISTRPRFLLASPIVFLNRT